MTLCSVLSINSNDRQYAYRDGLFGDRSTSPVRTKSQCRDSTALITVTVNIKNNENVEA
jgi:hypothetical protein